MVCGEIDEREAQTPMKEDDVQRLRHIKTYCEDIDSAIERFGADYQIFINDKDFFNSVSMSIMQVGELSLGFSEEFKHDTQDQMPWAAMRGMRNLFAYSYVSMNKKDIWKTAVDDIPKLLLFCHEVIEQSC